MALAEQELGRGGLPFLLGDRGLRLHKGTTMLALFSCGLLSCLPSSTCLGEKVPFPRVSKHLTGSLWNCINRCTLSLVEQTSPISNTQSNPDQAPSSLHLLPFRNVCHRLPRLPSQKHHPMLSSPAKAIAMSSLHPNLSLPPPCQGSLSPGAISVYLSIFARLGDQSEA